MTTDGKLTFGSLFAGIGGFDLGLERAGMTPAWQVEQNKNANTILERHWPDVPRITRIEECVERSLPTVDVLAGGDPCPKRSRARGSRASKHPDLAGYFLAVAGRLRPRWLVRENVPAPDALHFAIALDYIGYRACSFEFDSRYFTGQSRRRQILCGCLDHNASRRFERLVSCAGDGFGFSASSSEEETPVAACLTAHHGRVCAEDAYVYEDGIGLRVLIPEECESLQGFPRGWTDGLAGGRRRVLCGNAITVDVAEWIGRRIVEAM